MPSRPTKGTTEAVPSSPMKDATGGKWKLAGINYSQKRHSHLCWVRYPVGHPLYPYEWYHSASAALGQQCREVTKQQLVCDWWQPLSTDDFKPSLHSNYRGKFVQGGYCIHPYTNFCLYLKQQFNINSSEVAHQSRTSGCLVAGLCWPSAADEEWYSSKMPSSTVTVQLLIL